MMAGRNWRLGASLAAAALLAACGDAAGPGEPVAAGSASFSYTAGQAAAFSAQGAPEVDARGRARAGTWAAGGRSARYPGDKVVVTAFAGGSGAEGTLFALSVPRGAAGRDVPIDVNCAGPACAAGFLLFRVPPQVSDADPLRSCFINTGVVRVDDESAGRIRGRFSGRGVCVSDPGAPGNSTFTVENGVFDVAVAEHFRPDAAL
jgi:hypothetical protein